MMKIRYGLLCDFASAAPNTKVNLLGVFEDFTLPEQLPAIIPQFFVAISFSAETDGDHDVVIKVIDPDDNVLETVPFQGVKFTSGKTINILAQINNLTVKMMRPHMVRLFVDEKDLFQILIPVRKV